MNLLKSTEFLLKYLLLLNFLMLIVRRDFRIFSNLLVSFYAFSPGFGKSLAEIFINEILARKVHTVKPTHAEKSFHLPTARFCLKNETPHDENFSSWGKKKSLRSKSEVYKYSMKFKKMTDGIFLASIVK